MGTAELATVSAVNLAGDCVRDGLGLESRRRMQRQELTVLGDGRKRRKRERRGFLLANDGLYRSLVLSFELGPLGL
ncbi:hypothetical protein TIFTF001_040109 [Ficus carica]|uniref:Uncharacterized protein n=1 Tax=Ficus carica TaxID=3494 RepID=A0AA87YSK4_FICCA|nr:hypothetical protein TIFTF001_040109 [Ficus carica]